MKLKLLEFNHTFLALSNKWLNDEEVKKLTLTPDISEMEQRKWFGTLKNRDDYYVFGVLYDGIPIGAAGLKHIDYVNSVAEYFGYIGEKDFWGRGIGAEMEQSVEMIAKEKGIKKIYLHVAEYNIRAIKLYKKMNYVEDSQTGILIKMEKEL